MYMRSCICVRAFRRVYLREYVHVVCVFYVRMCARACVRACVHKCQWVRTENTITKMLVLSQLFEVL